MFVLPALLMEEAKSKVKFLDEFFRTEYFSGSIIAYKQVSYELFCGFVKNFGHPIIFFLTRRWAIWYKYRLVEAEDFGF